MIRFLYMLKRRKDLSVEAFREHWFDTHAPLVRRLAPALKIHRYVQTYPVDGTLASRLRSWRGLTEKEGYDGVAELWWRSMADMRGDSAEAREASALLLNDERRFLDLAACSLVIGEDREVISTIADRPQEDGTAETGPRRVF